MLETWFAQLEAGYPDIVSWRRHLHQYPELSFQETKTAKFIAERLRSFGLDVREGVGGHGLIARIDGKESGPTIALRADFDALPIADEKDVPYKSRVPGVMHACGHDGHTATLLGTARVLSGVRERLHGHVVLIFQHAEEKPPGGAQAMIAAGCLDGVDKVFGAHLTTQLPYGTVGLRAGAAMASADVFKINVQGKGGHGARPHQTVDALVVGTQIVNQLQQVVSRRIDPLQPAVVSVGIFQSGTSYNAVADSARIEGTVRTFDESVREQIEAEIRAIVKGACEAAHAGYEVQYERGYPCLVNHPEETRIVRQVVAERLPECEAVENKPKMSAEDFAYYLQRVPGAFYNIGAKNTSPHTHYTNHHPRFDFDERAMLVSGKVFLSLVSHYLLPTS
jgi:amidohydrolase